MALMWIGSPIWKTVPTSATSKRTGEGFAVFVGEEDDVRMIVGRLKAPRESARLLHEENASTGGWYLVKRDQDGRWRRADL